MEGKYDITIDGNSVGILTVGKEGAYTVFEARCQLLQGLTRLSVYGQGREGYLGLLMPGQGEMLMKKRLSPGAMREFPKKIEFVGQAGGMETKEEKEEEEGKGEEGKREGGRERGRKGEGGEEKKKGGEKGGKGGKGEKRKRKRRKILPLQKRKKNSRNLRVKRKNSRNLLRLKQSRQKRKRRLSQNRL